MEENAGTILGVLSDGIICLSPVSLALAGVGEMAYLP